MEERKKDARGDERRGPPMVVEWVEGRRKGGGGGARIGRKDARKVGRWVDEIQNCSSTANDETW